MDGDVDLVGAASHRLVHRVVDYLVDQVVQPSLTNVPDVHVRSLADRLQSFENLDVVGAVLLAVSSGELVRLGGLQGNLVCPRFLGT